MTISFYCSLHLKRWKYEESLKKMRTFLKMFNLFIFFFKSKLPLFFICIDWCFVEMGKGIDKEKKKERKGIIQINQSFLKSIIIIKMFFPSKFSIENGHCRISLQGSHNFFYKHMYMPVCVNMIDYYLRIFTLYL